MVCLKIVYTETHRSLNFIRSRKAETIFDSVYLERIKETEMNERERNDYLYIINIKRARSVKL